MRHDQLRTLLGVAALAAVLIGAGAVLRPFVKPIVWAVVLGSATWPAYRWLRRRWRWRRTSAAVAMTVIITLLVILPVGGLSALLVRELDPVVEELREWAAGEGELPDELAEVPVVRDLAQEYLSGLSDPEVRRQWIRRASHSVQGMARVGRSVLQNVLHLFLTLFTLFFVYRDGDALFLEVRLLLDRIAGGRGRILLGAVRTTVQAVVYGWLLTAAVQGLLAMVGYWAIGLRAPVTLGVASGLAAVIPFGLGLVWIPVSIGLLLQGSWIKALLVTAWSLGVVGIVDNFLRPLFISGPARIPFIVVFFGVLGGLAAFGLLGLVLGPVFLAVVLALWRTAGEVLAEPAPAEPA
jgi:predicted PurR-regulated permease PerM